MTGPQQINDAEDIDDPLALGFSAFYLNRTNRSGIIRGAGMIGGKAQSGRYKMGCRFNKQDLIGRLLRVARHKEHVTLTRLDAIEFMTTADCGVQKLFCIDPPYYGKGRRLYASAYKPEDHAEVAKTVQSLCNPWTLVFVRQDSSRSTPPPTPNPHLEPEE